ncbi:MAG: TonB-dependent receptor [Nitrospirae bacterium]|nr:TonB-dependent receptor [Nitrospirota bacterium]
MRASRPFVLGILIAFPSLVLGAWADPSGTPSEPAGHARIVLKGKVRENGNRKPIVGATIMLMGQANLTLTEFSDEQGLYTFKDLAPGPYQISVLAASYVVEKPRSVDLQPSDEPIEVNFFLTLDVTGGLFLEVEREREKRSVSTQKVRKEEIRRVPGTLGDPLRVIQLLPGVTVLNEVFADLIVQGGGPDDNKIWLDRTPMAFPYHLLNSSSVLSGEFVESQELHAAGFGVQYGDATGGVLEITSSDGKEQGIGGHLSVVGVRAYEAEKFSVGRVEGSLQAGDPAVGSVIAAGRYLFPPPTIPGFELPGQGPVFQFSPVGWDYQSKYTGKTGRMGTFRLLSYGAVDEEKQNIHFEGPVPQTGQNLTFEIKFLQEKQFHTQGILWDLPVGPVTSRLSLYRTENVDDFKISLPLLQLEDFIDRREANREFGIWDDLEILAGKHQTIILGVQAERVRSKIGGVAPVFIAAGGAQFRPPEDGAVPGSFAGGGAPARQESESEGGGEEEAEEEEEEEEFTPLSFKPFSVKETFNAYGFYLADKVRPVERLTLVPGVRLDRSTLVWKNSDVHYRDVFMPRAHGTFQLFSKTKLRGGWGIYRRFPEADQATDQGQVDQDGNVTRKFGNPYLLPERAVHYVGGVEQKLTEALRVEADVFHKKLTRLIMGEPESNDGSGYADGGQVLLRHDLTRRFFGWVSYSYTKSKRRNLRTGKLIPTQWDQPHVLSVVSSVKITPEWEVGASFRYTSGSPVTPIYNDEKRDPDLDEDIHADALPAEPNSGRMRDFQRLDLRVERSLKIRYAEIALFLDGFNVFNRKNEIFRIPSFEDPSQYIPLSTAGLLVYGGATARF